MNIINIYVYFNVIKNKLSFYYNEWVFFSGVKERNRIL